MIRRFVRAILIISLLAVAVHVHAQQATSTNYKLDGQSINSGASISTSSNYKIEGSVGAFIKGNLSSDNFVSGASVGIGTLGVSATGTDTLATEAPPEIAWLAFSYTNNGTPLDFPTGIDPLPNATRTVHVYGTIVDRNGAGTITGISGTFFRSGVGASCSPNVLNCHTLSCSFNQTATTTAAFDCTTEIPFYVDATTAGSDYDAEYWTASLTTTDNTSRSGVRAQSIEMNALLSVDVPTSFDFGSIAVGASTTASSNQELMLTQTGNVVVDVELSMANDPLCTNARSFSKSNLSWSLYDVGFSNIGSTTPLASSPVIAPLALPRTLTGASTTASLFWNINIPANSGVSGTCSGSLLMAVRAAQ